MKDLCPSPHHRHKRHKGHSPSANESGLDDLTAEAEASIEECFEERRLLLLSSDHWKSQRLMHASLGSGIIPVALKRA